MATATASLPTMQAVSDLRQVDESLTWRQAEVFLYIFDYTLDHGYQPSIRELMDAFSINSPNGILCHLKALSSKGWIDMAGGLSRSVGFLRNPDGTRFNGFRPREV